jgi:hypothetical protein
MAYFDEDGSEAMLQLEAMGLCRNYRFGRCDGRHEMVDWPK